MAENCANCKAKARYIENPKSFLGRLWRWHINWCPGWKAYQKSLSEEEKSIVNDEIANLDKIRKS